MRDPMRPVLYVLLCSCAPTQTPSFTLYKGMRVYCDDLCVSQGEMLAGTEQWLVAMNEYAGIAPRDARAWLSHAEVYLESGDDMPPCASGTQQGWEMRVRYRGGCLLRTAFHHELGHYLRRWMRGDGDPAHADDDWWLAVELAAEQCEAARRWCK